ncbi:HAMP domain-containing sensor histidine kinase [Paenibacillus hodogayensis]|uniref:histidine kinase n=1 Tax=Paenibacillus hodogayensis TaxID=279208 RepID=A0ABV5VYE9_9BACL
MKLQSLKHVILISLAVAAAGFVAVYGSLVWMLAKANQTYAGQQTVQTSLLLSSSYELYGSWDKAAVKLGELPLLQEHPLQIWTNANELVWTKQPPHSRTDEANWSSRQPILLHGQVIGTFSGSFAPTPLAFSYPHWIAAWSGLGMGCLTYIALRQQRTAYERRFEQIRLQLHEIDAPYTADSFAKEQDQRNLERIDVSIHRLGDRLQRLETVRKSMVADIAHELRTPLTVLRTKLDYALQHGHSLSHTEVVLLQDEVYRMSKLLGDLQQLALAESGHLQLDRRWFPISELIGQLVSLFAIQAEEDGITIVYDSPLALSIYADENRLKQVILNLLGNALKYARSKVVLTLALEHDQYVITIADDGPGIEEEELPYLFDRFYQGTSKRRSEPAKSSAGLGLGLSIAKSLVEAHRGAISVSSRWQEGSSFRIALPVLNEGT